VRNAINNDLVRIVHRELPRVQSASIARLRQRKFKLLLVLKKRPPTKMAMMVLRSSAPLKVMLQPETAYERHE